jgi:hypothetical protein
MILFKSAKTKEKIQEEDETQKFIDHFNELMFEFGLVNNFDLTYDLQILKKTEYGYFAHLFLETGLTFSKLKPHIGEIQESLACIWGMKTEAFRTYAEVEIITVPMDPFYPYKDPEIKPWQMYLGINMSKNPIINVDNVRTCMFMVGGATGAGKTCFLYQLLLSYVLGCTPQEVELYIADISKNEFANWANVKHVRYYASELEQLYVMMKYITVKAKKRVKAITQLREQGIATNITEYNKAMKAALSYVYVLIDEFSVLNTDKTDTDEEKKMKEELLAMLKYISKNGRNLGIFCILATQKTVKDEIPPILKNMSAVRISFRANDTISSEVIMGDRSAVGLMDRYAVYSFHGETGGDEKNLLYSPYLPTKMLNELLAPYVAPDKFKIDFKRELAEWQESQPVKGTKKEVKDKKKKTKPHYYEQIDTTKTGNNNKGGGYTDY